MTEDDISKAFQNYYPSLLLFANKWVKDEDLAKDIVQAVFVGLLETHNKKKILDLRPYLYQSVRNRCIDHLRKHSSQSDSIDDVDPTTHSFFKDPMEEAEFEAYVFNLIETLSPATKNIFKLSRFEGLTNQEIADKLNLSKRTVELQISNALKVLREKLFDPKHPKTAYSRYLVLLF